MVQGMAFLSKKGFNPHNHSNRQRVYEAQQEAKIREQKHRQRQEQLKRERDEEELARVRDGERGGRRTQLSFMYHAPPGLEGSAASNNDGNDHERTSGVTESSRAAGNDLTQIQDGDDEAAAAFRQLLASHQQDKSDEHPSDDDDEGCNERQIAESGHDGQRFTPVLQGSNIEAELSKQKNAGPSQKGQQQNIDSRSALEKAVGRRDKGGALSWEEQVARFPQLKNAPKAKGMSNTDVNVSFKPLGAQLRNVRCMACGVWGHSRGDRECSKTGWNPFDMRTKAAAPVSGSTAGIGDVTTARSKSSIMANASTSSSSLTNKRRSKKRGRRSRYDSDDTSSSSSSRSDDRYRRRKRHKKHKKSRKRRGDRRSTHFSDDSSSDDSDTVDSDERRNRSSRRRKSKRPKKHRRRHRERSRARREDSDYQDASSGKRGSENGV